MNASPTLGELMRRAGNLDVRTMILDVEPLVTYWGNKVVTLSRPQQWPGQRDQN